jgi:hypothetical protein
VTPLELVAATKQTISKSGGGFMLHPRTMERAGELGLQPFSFYYFGRCGVLGDVDPAIVAPIIAFFPDHLVEKSWRKGRAVLEPEVAAREYAACCHEWGRRHLADAEGLGRLCELAERVSDAADATALPLFAGWRALALPDDAPARAAHLLNVLREHRGGLHVLAVRASGLDPLEAVVSGSGSDSARFFGWPEPYPDATDAIRARRDRAEALTDELAAPAFAVLDEPERTELAELCAGVKAAAKAAAGR